MEVCSFKALLELLQRGLHYTGTLQPRPLSKGLVLLTEVGWPLSATLVSVTSFKQWKLSSKRSASVCFFLCHRGFFCCCNQKKTPDYPPIASVVGYRDIYILPTLLHRSIITSDSYIFIRIRIQTHIFPLHFQSNSTMNNSGEAGMDRVSYRLQVVKALVQRYIEAARREFGEATRKGRGTKCAHSKAC